MIWPHSTSEFAIMELEKTSDALHLSNWFFLADRFTKGHTIDAGSQYMRLEHGPWDQVMCRYQEWYEDINLSVPADRPEWCIGAAIYEVHVGCAPFLEGVNYEPYPKMADLANDLPRIASLGFEVIQIMPHWPFCGYTVHDYYQIDKQYGDEEELKAVVRLAHSLGLKVILDIVLHGCVDREIIEWDMSVLDPRYDFIFSEWLKAADAVSRYRVEHPEWFMQDENGETAKIYTWAFDHANKGFQEFLIEVLKHYLDDLGVDGFRFDAPTWNCMPNWASGIPERASAAYYASYHLLKRVRKEIKPTYPSALLYTEPSGPLFRNLMDLTYNYDEEWLSGSLMEVTSERGYAGARLYNGRRINARDVARWLHYRQLALPADSITVHHLDSHDTFWWGEKAQFRWEAFGIEASRSLFAMFALVGGGIMNYVGGERGSEEFFRRLLRLRQSDKALRFGDCDYFAISCDQDMVLALLRTFKNEHAIPLVNLSPEKLNVILQIPVERLGSDNSQAFVIYDLLNHVSITSSVRKRYAADDLNHLLIDLPAYGVRVLRFYPIMK
jgi:glycosidase